MSIEKILTELTAAIDRLTAAVAGGYNPAGATAPAPAKPAKGKAAKAPEPEAVEPEPEAAPAKPAKAATQAECTTLAQALLQGQKRDALVALLADVGAPNVRSIPPEKYGDFVQAAKAALEA